MAACRDNLRSLIEQIGSWMFKNFELFTPTKSTFSVWGVESWVLFDRTPSNIVRSSKAFDAPCLWGMSLFYTSRYWTISCGFQIYSWMAVRWYLCRFFPRSSAGLMWWFLHTRGWVWCIHRASGIPRGRLDSCILPWSTVLLPLGFSCCERG